jgi:formamidopyrimidine-DNA glycosylase
MPESPEVQALVEELAETLTGRSIAEVDVLEFRVTKTRPRPLTTLVGERVTGATRFGKLIALAFDGSE